MSTLSATQSASLLASMTNSKSSLTRLRGFGNSRKPRKNILTIRKRTLRTIKKVTTKPRNDMLYLYDRMSEFKWSVSHPLEDLIKTITHKASAQPGVEEFLATHN